MKERDAVGPRWPWYRDPYRSEPYGNSEGELSRNMHSCPIFIPGHSFIGSVARFDSSSVTCPEKPGSMNPAVECVTSPSRPSELFPSSLDARSSGSVMTSYVEAS